MEIDWIQLAVSSLVLITILWVHLKPVTQRWAVRRHIAVVYRWCRRGTFYLTPSPQRFAELSQLQRYKWKVLDLWVWVSLNLPLRLMAWEDKAKSEARMKVVMESYLRPVSDREVVATSDVVTLVLAIEMAKEEHREDKRFRRRHKAVRCAGGCGTRYGKFHGDDPYQPAGHGWKCPDNLSCVIEATGPHWCRKCWLDRLPGAQEGGSPNARSSSAGASSKP